MPVFPTSAREDHARRVVQLVHAGTAHTRQALADALGTSVSLVSRVTSDLVRAGVLVARADEEAHGPGRPVERLTVHPEAGRTLGVEVADGRLRIVACDATGRIRGAHAEEGAGGVSASALACVVEAIEAWAHPNDPSLPPVLGVGVALHDVVTADGHWLRAGTPGDPVPARRILEEALHLQVWVEDVSRAFAEAEHRFGAGRDAPDMLYLFLGRDGVGSGIFADDVPLRSRSGICGEVGHIPVVPDGARCSCGNRGCLETVATHAALLGRARAYLDQGVASELGADVTMPALTAAARRGDEVATLVFHDLAVHLGASLTGAISVTGATTVVLGGDVRDSGPGLAARLRQELEHSLLQSLATEVAVRYAELPETAGAQSVAMSALDAAVATGALARVHRERGVIG